MTLTIPTHRDPVARAALIACALALIWLAITSAMPPVQAQEQPQTIILVATPTQAPAAPAVVAPAVAAATAIPPTPVPTEAPPAVAPAPVQEEEAPRHVGEMWSDKAGPGQKIAPPVVRH